MYILILSVFQPAYSCPIIEGSFFDSEAETTKTIKQVGCEKSIWSEEGDTVTLIADAQERLIQSEGRMKAFGKVHFSNGELIIDIRVDYGGANDFDLHERFLTSYRIDKFSNLVEKIIPFKRDGSQLATEYVTFRRVK